MNALQTAFFTALGLIGISAFANESSEFHLDLDHPVSIRLDAFPSKADATPQAPSQGKQQLTVLGDKLYYERKEGSQIILEEVPPQVYGGRVPRGAIPFIFNGEICFWQQL